ncbi:hypothetical protein HYU40_01245 [Candidatus Woesearchaeota archaeon]|nr:hypothetical protein [Candidatus Woesearchaeota archaeon]
MQTRPELKRLKDANSLIKKLREADIILVSEKGLLHGINRMLQRSKWHHVMMYMGQGRTIEVTPRKGCHICDLMYDLTEKEYFAYKVLRNKRLTKAQRKRIVNEALKLFLGKKFSWLQYAKIVIGRTLELWREEGNKSLVCKPGHKCSAGTVACSNMVAMAYYEAGFPVSEKYMPEYVVPKDYETSKKLTLISGGAIN